MNIQGLEKGVGTPTAPSLSGHRQRGSLLFTPFYGGWNLTGSHPGCHRQFKRRQSVLQKGHIN